MAFLFADYKRQKKDPDNIPELQCAVCEAVFPVYLASAEAGFETARFACERCPDLAVMSGDGFYAYLDPSVRSYGLRNSIVQKNLKPCPRDGAPFVLTDEIFCPLCHAALPDWSWSYFLIADAGDDAFADTAAKQEYLDFWRKTSGDPLSLKRMTEKALALGREGRLRLERETLRNIKARHYFISGSCYHNEEIIVPEPGRDLLELIAGGFEAGFDEKDESAVLLGYQRAYSLSRLCGRGFERIADLPRVLPKAREKVRAATADDLTRQTIRKLVRSFTAEGKKAELLTESERAVRLKEMLTKVAFWRNWWMENKDRWPV